MNIACTNFLEFACVLNMSRSKADYMWALFWRWDGHRTRHHGFNSVAWPSGAHGAYSTPNPITLWDEWYEQQQEQSAPKENNYGG